MESRELFSKRFFVVVVVDLSPGVVADQDVDRRVGAVHRVCFPICLVPLHLALSARDGHWTSQPELLPDRPLGTRTFILHQLVLQHLCVLHHGLSLQRHVPVLVRNKETGESPGKVVHNKDNIYFIEKDPQLYSVLCVWLLIKTLAANLVSDFPSLQNRLY